MENMISQDEFPLWISDVNCRPVFFNRRLRTDLGLKLEHITKGVVQGDGTYRPLEFTDIFGPEFYPCPPQSGQVTCTQRKVKFADGEHMAIIYVRELRFRGKMYGYIGSLMNADTAYRSLAPRPLRSEAMFHEKLHMAFDFGSCLADVHSAYLNALGPLLDGLDPVGCEDLTEVRAKLWQLRQLGLAIDPLCPSEDFVANIPTYSDINYDLISQHAGLSIHAYYIVKDYQLPTGERFSFNRHELELWHRAAGLEYGIVDSSSCSKIDKLRAHDIDVMLEDDPEEWILSLFYGIPTFLIDRPQNHHLRTDFRVYSVETFMQAVGLEPDQTFCEYDPALYHDMKISSVA